MTDEIEQLLRNLHLKTIAAITVGSGNSGRWIPEILAPSPETLAV